MSKVNTTTVTVMSFFTFMMFWTLNGDEGKDMNDVIVKYWQVKTDQMEGANND